MSAVAFTAARLIDPVSGRDERGSLFVQDGRIVSSGADIDIPANAERIDCRGHLLCPGLVDMRSFAAEPRAAAAGGITTAVLMPDKSTPLDSAALIAQAQDRDARGGVRLRAMGAATKGCKGQALSEMGLMHEAGAVGFTDGRRPIAVADLMRMLLEYAQVFDAPIVSQPLEPSLTSGGTMNEGEAASRLGLQGISVAAETIMIERDARLAALTGGRVHIGQISAAESVDIVRRVKDAGVALSVAVSPHYFTLNESAVGDYRTFAKVMPPLRTEDDRRALAEAVLDGTVDVICSSHEPRSQDAKRLPFSEAAPGVLGYETLLPLTLALHHNHGADLPGLLARLTSAPAKLLGLDAGTLATGAPADLIVVDIERPWRVDPDKLASETANTPFEGLPLQGKVLRTMVGGVTVFKESR